MARLKDLVKEARDAGAKMSITLEKSKKRRPGRPRKAKSARIMAKKYAGKWDVATEETDLELCQRKELEYQEEIKRLREQLEGLAALVKKSDMRARFHEQDGKRLYREKTILMNALDAITKERYPLSASNTSDNEARPNAQD